MLPGNHAIRYSDTSELPETLKTSRFARIPGADKDVWLIGSPKRTKEMQGNAMHWRAITSPTWDMYYSPKYNKLDGCFVQPMLSTQLHFGEVSLKVCGFPVVFIVREILVCR